MTCKPITIPINHIKQKNLCGCGLAALEMVLKYYGATDTQTDFLSHRSIRKQVSSAKKGLSEGTVGTLALRRGFDVTIYGEKPRLTKTFFKLGGKFKRVRANKNLILQCLQRHVPPIVLIPRVDEAYEHERDEIGHYVVIGGSNSMCQLHVADPQYRKGPRQDYWDSWSSSLIEIQSTLSRKRESANIQQE